MKQRSFASLSFESKKKPTRRERFLGEMDKVVLWAALLAELPHSRPPWSVVDARGDHAAHPLHAAVVRAERPGHAPDKEGPAVVPDPSMDTQRHVVGARVRIVLVVLTPLRCRSRLVCKERRNSPNSGTHLRQTGGFFVPASVGATDAKPASGGRRIQHPQGK